MSAERFLDGLERRAAERLPAEVFRYFQQGARDGVSAAEATAAWERIRFLPQVLRDVTDLRTATSLLGTYVGTPFAVAPTTLQRAAHPDGEVAMAAATAAAGSLMVVSSNAGSSFEDVAATGVDWWLQMYVTAERATSLPLLERAVAAGAKAVVMTVDTPVVGTKYAGPAGSIVWDAVEPGWLHANFAPGYGSSPSDEKATDLGPQDIEWLARVTGLPVVAKGVLRTEDARRCQDAGAAAVWVSNHGGRQLDRTAATADRLAAVVAAAGATTEVYVDGGVRSAGHALAALALGARGVFLGRLPVYALAVDGPRGVGTMFEELRTELVEALMLTGCPSVAAVSGAILA